MTSGRLLENRFRMPFMGSGKWPDFIGLGVARCGTTWLYDMLSQHPEISFARADRENAFCYPAPELVRLKEEDHFPVKEVQFWNHIFYPFNEKRRFFSQYKNLFRHSQPDQRSGEITNNYLLFLFDPAILKAFHTNMPHTKLFAVLRNPIDRFISHHFYQYDIMDLHREMGWNHSYYAKGKMQSLKKDIEQVMAWVQLPGSKNPFSPPAVRLFSMGLYAACLENLLTLYEKRQIHIILFDDIRENPGPVLKKLCEFLGIDPKFEFKKVDKPSNKTKAQKRVTLTERRVLTELYAPSIRRISRMLDRDLSHWLES